MRVAALAALIVLAGLFSVGPVIMSQPASAEKAVTPSPSAEWVNKGGRGRGYCRTFRLANNCQVRWDRHDHACVCINRTN
jgi:hypothetical protein